MFGILYHPQFGRLLHDEIRPELACVCIISMFTVVQINHTQANLLAVAKVADRPFCTSLATPVYKHRNINIETFSCLQSQGKTLHSWNMKVTISAYREILIGERYFGFITAVLLKVPVCAMCGSAVRGLLSTFEECSALSFRARRPAAIVTARLTTQRRIPEGWSRQSFGASQFPAIFQPIFLYFFRFTFFSFLTFFG